MSILAIVNDTIAKYESFKKAQSSQAEIEKKQFVIGRLVDLLENGTRAILMADWCLEALDMLGADRPKDKADALQNIKDEISSLLNLDSRSGTRKIIVSMSFSELNQLYMNLGTKVESAIPLENALKERIRTECGEWLQRCRVAKQILKIPGIMKTNNEAEKTLESIRNLEELASTIKTAAEMQAIPNPIRDIGKAWKRASEVFEKFAISYDSLKKEFDLSKGAVEIIKRLLNGDKIPLSTIDKDDITQLHKIKAFSSIIALQFTEPK